MRIPPYYRKPSWQSFLSGMAIGGMICWGIFLYFNGVLQEKQARIIHTQNEKIHELKKEIEIWQEEFQTLNKKNIDQMTLQEIKIRLINHEKYKFDSLTVFQIEDSVKEDINMIMAKDLETIYKSRELIRKAIENKVIKVNDKRYRLKIKEIFIYTTLSIQLEIQLTD